MLQNKTIDRVCCAALALMLAITAALWAGKAAAGPRKALAAGYESLFDASAVHAIDIQMADWDAFIQNATAEEYVECAVVIDGVKVSNAGIRAKGNTSLSSVASMGSQKYSFKIEFDHFVEGRSYQGLDKLSLNNLIYDATMMKDYLAYTLMNRMGVPASLCSFAQVSVNGQPWGLYLAVEGVEDSFLERNRMTAGELYKPDSMNFGGGRGNGRNFDIEQFRTEEDGQAQAGGDDFSASFGGQAGDAAPNGGFPGSGGNAAAPSDGQQQPAPADQPDGAQPDNGQQNGMQSNGAQQNGAQQNGMQSNGAQQNGAQQNGMQQPGGAPSQGTQPNGGQPNGGFPGSGGNAAAPSDGQQQPSPEGQGQDDAFPGSSGNPAFSLPEGEGFRGGFGFNFGMGNSDVRLQYVDDEIDSYANIFSSAKTKITPRDQARLIQALKALGGEDPESAVFGDEVIRYLAVHDFLQNDDSYTGMMVHNYYLYEENGRLAILPWDYNLAFGTMNGVGSASSVINSPIDSPVSNGSAADRPLVGWILSDADALNRYHEIYDQFIAETVESGWLEAEIARVAEMLRPCVEADENGFFSVAAFEEGVKNLQAYCALRGESVRGQLVGTIPSTSDGQRNSAALVKADGLNLSALGSMTGGFGGGGFGGGFGGGGFDFAQPGENGGAAFGNWGNSFGGRAGTENSDGNAAEAAPGAPSDPAPAAQAPEAPRNDSQRQRAGGMASGGFSPFGAQQEEPASMSWLELGLYAAILLLALALVFRAPEHNR